MTLEELEEKNKYQHASHEFPASLREGAQLAATVLLCNSLATFHAFSENVEEGGGRNRFQS